jgi:hypothetical protein
VNSSDKHAIQLGIFQLGELRAKQAVQPVMRVMLDDASANEKDEHDLNLRCLAAKALITIVCDIAVIRH